MKTNDPDPNFTLPPFPFWKLFALYALIRALAGLFGIK